MPKNTTVNQAKYDSTHIMQVSLKLHKKNDADIIKAIDPKNKQGSIKELLRRGIEN